MKDAVVEGRFLVCSLDLLRQPVQFLRMMSTVECESTQDRWLQISHVRELGGGKDSKDVGVVVLKVERLLNYFVFVARL